MKLPLKNLLKGSFLYGGGQLLAKLLTFLLLPLTTTYLTSEDYGIIGQLALMGQCLSGFFTLGFAVSLSRSMSSAADAEEELMGTSVTALFVQGTLLLLAAAVFSTSLSRLLFGQEQFADLVVYSLFSLMIGSVVLPFQVWLRLKEKAVVVVSIAIVEVMVTLSVTVYSIVNLEMGCRGQIFGAISGQLVSAALLIFAYLRYASLRMTRMSQHLPELIKVGSPYIFSLVGYFLLSCSGRYLCRLQCGLEETGLYFMSQNFGRLAELFVTGFISAWSPFAYQYIDRQEEAARVFGKVFTYYAAALSLVIAGLFAFSRPMVSLMVDAEFATVWKLVGLASLPYALWGAYGISATPLIFHKKGLWQVFIEILGGLACMATCAILCPYYGSIGACLGTLCGFAALLAMSFYVNHQLLPVRYEVNKLLLVCAGLSMVGLLSFAPVKDLTTYTSVMAVALALLAAAFWQLVKTREITAKQQMSYRFE